MMAYVFIQVKMWSHLLPPCISKCWQRQSTSASMRQLIDSEHKIDKYI